MALNKTLLPCSPTRGNGVFLVPSWFLGFYLLFFTACIAVSAPAEKAASKPFRVFTKREGNTTRFFVENFEAAEITATFEMELENLTGSTNFPYTTTFAPNKVSEAFTLWPAKADVQWNYSYTTHYTMGSSVAVHDANQVYMLPFESGTAYRVTQGYNGSYSHTGPDQYAIDFRMPVGTPVHAARGGKIVKVKVDSSVGGGDRKYQNNANYILIRHSDGTLANYAHLKKDGSVVTVGQMVGAGDLIGYSGNTGFSSGPHLHFSVFKTRDGTRRQTLPVKFRTSDTAALTLVEGKSYTCAHHAVAQVKPSRPAPILSDGKAAAGRP
jgi:murein DD-endopeptidase MepM/ murein hydrolase activator NlpD